jgi:hypothetical protein
MPEASVIPNKTDRIVEHITAQSSAVATRSGEAKMQFAPLTTIAPMHPYLDRIKVVPLNNDTDGLIADKPEHQQPPPPQLPSQLGTFQTGYIAFDDPVPVGGSATLTLFQDGSYAFNGSFHDSGAPSYNVDFAWVIVSNSGRAYTFAVQGHMAGTFESGSRDYSWTQNGTNDDIAAHWADLSAGWTYRWQANVNFDAAKALDAIISGLTTAGTVIGAVIAVVALF